MEGGSRYSATQKSVATDSRKQDEPGKNQQDGNFYPLVAMATPIRVREASRSRQHGEWNEGGHADEESDEVAPCR